MTTYKASKDVHASRHAAGGADAITVVDSQLPATAQAATLNNTYAPKNLAVRRLTARSRTIHPTPPTVTMGAVWGAHGIASGVTIGPLTVAEQPFLTKCGGGSFVDIGSARITAGHTNPGTAVRDPFSIETNHYGTVVSFNITSAPGNYYRVWVDDQPVTTWTPVAGPGDGGAHWLNLTFGSSALRKIRLDLTYADIINVAVGPTDSLGRTRTRGPRCVIIGDSYTQGAGAPPTGFNAMPSWVQSFGDYMGWDDVWNSGIGGTGWIAGSPNYQTRAAGIVTQAPDVVIISGIKNDVGSTPAQVGTAGAAVLSTLRAGLPNATLIVAGPIFPNAPLAPTPETVYWKTYQDALFAAVAPYNVLTISTCGAIIFTGSGKAGTTTGAGNGDVFIQSDGTHPTQIGADYLGARLAALIAAVIP